MYIINRLWIVSYLGDDSDIVVLDGRRPDDLQVLVLQDHLVIILFLPEVEASVALSGSLLRQQAQILSLYKGLA